MSILNQRKIIGKRPTEPITPKSLAFGFTVKNNSDKTFSKLILLNPCFNLGKENLGLPPEISVIGNYRDISYSNIMYDLLSSSYKMQSIEFTSQKKEWMPNLFELNYKNILDIKFPNKFIVKHSDIKKVHIDKLIKTDIYKYSTKLNLHTHKHMSFILDIKPNSELLILFSVEPLSQKNNKKKAN